MPSSGGSKSSNGGVLTCIKSKLLDMKSNTASIYLFLLEKDRISLCRPDCPGAVGPGWPGTHTDLPASASQVLELKV